VRQLRRRRARAARRARRAAAARRPGRLPRRRRVLERLERGPCARRLRRAAQPAQHAGQPRGQGSRQHGRLCGVPKEWGVATSPPARGRVVVGGARRPRRPFHRRGALRRPRARRRAAASGASAASAAPGGRGRMCARWRECAAGSACASAHPRPAARRGAPRAGLLSGRQQAAPPAAPRMRGHTASVPGAAGVRACDPSPGLLQGQPPLCLPKARLPMCRPGAAPARAAPWPGIAVLRHVPAQTTAPIAFVAPRPRSLPTPNATPSSV
jgi:hypothetical protein